MPVAPNHSGNLPRDFEYCPECGRKGLYRYGGRVWRMPNGKLSGMPPGRRCKYCRHAIPDCTTQELETEINR